MTRPGGLAWFGATLVWVGAAALSFAGLHDLAVSCGVSPWLAWLLPLVIDVGVAVAAWVWRRGVNPDAARLAGRLTWSLLGLTITGNGAHLGMAASGITPPWWVAALVGAVPPAVAGAVAHLLVLLGRTGATDGINESLVAVAREDGVGGRPAGEDDAEPPEPVQQCPAPSTPPESEPSPRRSAPRPAKTRPGPARGDDELSRRRAADAQRKRAARAAAKAAQGG